MSKSISVFDRDFTICDEVSEMDAIRVLSKLDFTSNEEGCWLWTGYRDPRGYGRTYYGTTSRPAHRVVYSYLVGPVEPDMQLHHTCVIPACCNPAHLMKVTPRDHVLYHTPNSITATFARRTQCAKGHDMLDPDNIYVYPGSGVRRCKTCLREWERNKYRETHPKRDGLRTHCFNGHELTDENVYEYSKSRFCRTCHNINSAEYYERKREAESEAKIEVKQTGTIVPNVHNGQKTHCPYGHEYTAENTKIRSTKKRVAFRLCRTCSHFRRKADWYRKQGRLEEAEAILAQLKLPQPVVS